MRHFYGLQDNIIIDRAFALSNVFFYDNRDNRNNSGNGRNGRMSRDDIQLGQQDYCFQFVNRALFLEDNRDNRNNKKNGHNCGMSRGDIQPTHS